MGTKWIRWGVSNKFAMLDLNAHSTSVFTPKFKTSEDTVVNITIGDIVYNDAPTLVVDRGYWEAKSTRSSIDLSTETFEEGAHWAVSSNSLVVEFRRGDIDTLILGNYSASTITVEALDAVGGNPIVGVTQTREYGPNYDVLDYYTYMYSKYTVVRGLDAVFEIPIIGTSIRVTFHNTSLTAITGCGFLVGGESNLMGDSLFGVGFSFNSYSVKETDDFGVTTILKRGVQELVDFETEIPSTTLPSVKRKIKEIYDEVVVFIVDPGDDSAYENIITLGIVDNVTTVLANPVQAIISWSVQEVI